MAFVKSHCNFEGIIPIGSGGHQNLSDGRFGGNAIKGRRLGKWRNYYSLWAISGRLPMDLSAKRPSEFQDYSMRMCRLLGRKLGD